MRTQILHSFKAKVDKQKGIKKNFSKQRRKNKESKRISKKSHYRRTKQTKKTEFLSNQSKDENISLPETFKAEKQYFHSSSTQNNFTGMQEENICNDNANTSKNIRISSFNFKQNEGQKNLKFSTLSKRQNCINDEVIQSMIQSQVWYIPQDKSNSDVNFLKNRKKIVSWIINFMQQINYHLETIFMAINMMDRFMGVQHIDVNQYIIVAITCMIMAGKYEEYSMPRLQNLVKIIPQEHQITKQDVLKCQGEIIIALEFNMNYPAPNLFISQYCLTNNIEENVKNQILKVCLQNLLENHVKFLPSSSQAQLSIEAVLLEI